MKEIMTEKNIIVSMRVQRKASDVGLHIISNISRITLSYLSRASIFSNEDGKKNDYLDVRISVKSCPKSERRALFFTWKRIFVDTRRTQHHVIHYYPKIWKRCFNWDELSTKPKRGK